jgi:hypothetical protein
MSLTSIRVCESRHGAFVTGLASMFRGLLQNTLLALLAIMATVSAASAETLLMPNRDARQGVPVVVWGVHAQAQGTVCALDFGDLSGIQNCTATDRSYIAFPHTYASQGTYTIRLTVGTETTTTTIQVFNPALLIGGAAGDNNRSLGINMAIQDGLRFLWQSQANRTANFPAGTTTNWGNTYPAADASLAVLAFENQGYKLPANPAVQPTGIYEKYIVRRGINYVLSQLTTITMAAEAAGNPCQVYADCVGLYSNPSGDQSYTTSLAILSFAGSGALSRVNTEVAGYTSGKTYGEVLQRLVNALVWGQVNAGVGQGGWYYTFNSSVFDGSTAGWAVLAFLDAQAAGATVPAFAKTEFKKGFDNALNSDGSFDYQAVANGKYNDGPHKVGIGLQGLFLIGETSGSRVDAVKNNLNSWWNGGTAGIGGNPWDCYYAGDGATYLSAAVSNKGCAYSMFNNFKGLKLQNIVTLPGVTRPAGPGAQPAGDWYADYQDWFVANQNAPGTVTGGGWPVMGFSCCYNYGAAIVPINTAIAELILSPVALVAPDPVLFSTVGLSPLTATNPVGTDHTVTAFAQAANNAPVPGVTITFKVNSGPNVGKTGTGTTGADGKTSYTYHDDGGAGTDEIQAFIGTTLSSNKVIKIWGLACDLNNDGVVTNADILLIQARLNTVATGPTDPFDANRDGVINVADMRYCQLRIAR